jgi:hypothetical protein
MWPGMRPATGWIAKLDLDAALQLLGQFPDLVLGLRDRHPVAGMMTTRSAEAIMMPASAASMGFMLPLTSPLSTDSGRKR